VKKGSIVLTALLIFSSLSIQAFQQTIVAGDENEKIDSIKLQLQINEHLDLISATADPFLMELTTTNLILPKLFAPTVEGKLKQLNVTSSLPLDYNPQVQSFIDKYSNDRYISYLSRMMGLGSYYFPIYDQVFESFDMPKELKYLSIVESALNPHAVSRVGATGLWQFMFATAKVYGLRMDRHMDERKDPYIATHTAARYLKECYEMFGDWLLAIAAYNCGPGNVSRAIKKSGQENPTFWSLSSYLPKETRNYVPAFIAMTYMMEYHEEHGIKPVEAPSFAEATQTISVYHPIPFKAIAEVLNTDVSVLKYLNPAYKQDFVHGSYDSPMRLVLPKVAAEHYDPLYAVLNKSDHAIKREVLLTSSGTGVVHVVKKGDTLSGIAKKYKGATVNGIKSANNLKSNQIKPGMKLQIF
jgi:membrane-bound lytic murein transglycosylase D